MNNNQTSYKDLKKNLKSIMEEELNNLPELLNELEPMDRLTVVLKFLPYVLPKVQTVTANDGEPIANWFG